MNAAVVSKKGWVVIPRAYRRRYKIEPGSKVAFVDHGGVLALVPIPDDPIQTGFGFLREAGDTTSWTAEIVAEHARERELEDRAR